jgi:hypothetical protein
MPVPVQPNKSIAHWDREGDAVQRVRFRVLGQGGEVSLQINKRKFTTQDPEFNSDRHSNRREHPVISNGPL